MTIRRNVSPLHAAHSPHCSVAYLTKWAVAQDSPYAQLPANNFARRVGAAKTPFVLFTSAGFQSAQTTTSETEKTMRFVVIVAEASKDTEAGVMPGTELLTAMGSLTRKWSRPASSRQARIAPGCRRARG